MELERNCNSKNGDNSIDNFAVNDDNNAIDNSNAKQTSFYVNGITS